MYFCKLNYVGLLCHYLLIRQQTTKEIHVVG